MKFLKIKMKNKGFTLIELLVVIAIIGVLASVVLASLNSARTKGQIASIKSNLKNMIPQAELSYSDNGSYSGINTSNSDTTCIGSLANMAQSITNLGATVRCLSYNNSSLSDVNLRYGATVLLGTSTPIKAYSVNPTGVSTWDTADLTIANLPGATAKNWDDANTACSAVGGRLPTFEELKTLSDASFTASGSHTPPSFVGVFYWSRTTVPSTPANAYKVSMGSGNFYGDTSKTSNYFVRCVR